MWFRIIIVCAVLASSYALYELWRINSFFSSMAKPEAAFTVLSEGNPEDIAIVEFIDYGCQACRTSHLAALDYSAANPDIRYVVRPVPTNPPEKEWAALMVLAAGLQGKFAEVDRAIAEYEGELDDKFFRETAAVYELDYDRMVRDAQGDEVFALAKDNAQKVVNIGMQTTPAFLIGKTLYQPTRPLTLPDIIRMVQAEQGTGLTPPPAQPEIKRIEQ